MKRQSLTERRSMLGRMTLQLCNKNGPLTEQERTRLRSLRIEMDELEGDITLDSDRKYRAAYLNWLRFGLEGSQYSTGIRPEERQLLESRVLGAGGQSAYPGATSGFFVPTEFSGRVDSAMKDAGPMLALATIDDTLKGAPRGYPQDDDTSITGELVDEQAELTGRAADTYDIANPKLTILKTYKFSSRLVKVPVELATDVGFDLEGYLARRFGQRLARIANTKFTSGTGTQEPFGFLTRAARAGTAVGAGANDGTSGANTLGTGDFSTLESSVDPAYRRNAVWMMHPNTLAALRKQKDKAGRPLYSGLHAGGEDTIFNYPTALNPNMDELQAGASSPLVTRTPLAFGDFSKYQIRRVPPLLVRLQTRFIEEGFLAYILWWRMDGDLIDGGGGAVKTIQTVF